MMELSTVGLFLKEAEESNSQSHKLEVLSKFKDSEVLKKVFLYTYNGFWRYFITAKALAKETVTPGTSNNSKNIFEVLDRLRKREVTGKAAMEEVVDWMNGHTSDENEIMKRIIARDLKCHISRGLIEKVHPNLIPTFTVALANKFDPEKAPDFDKDIWYMSRKLDGVRCIVVCEYGTATSFSRSGKVIETVDKLNQEVERMAVEASIDNFVLDGELCYVDRNGDEDFQAMMKMVRRKDYQIQSFKFKAFDFLELEVFNEGKGGTPLQQRIDHLKEVCGKAQNLEHVDPVQMFEVSNLEWLEEQQSEASNNGWEGLMIRKNVPYTGKRNKDLLKLKKFFDDEFRVISAEMGVIDDGKGNKVEGLSAVVIDYGDGINTVRVGSGFSFEERLKFWKNPELIEGKLITVKYFERTKAQDDSYSLRFPIFKGIQGVTREY
jgi:DNA ligase-1